MIRIRLINEGRVVKQITSRIHEGVVLEQVKNYKDPFDTIQIVEGELSEDAKSMLQHVARKIIPAAMAAGVAMSGAGPAQAQGGANPNYPGLNHSVGQHMADIFSPNYKELKRQREYNRNTERQVWDAEQNEIRKQRMADARARAGGGAAPVQKHMIYDQSRLSKDGKSYIIYGIDNTVRRIPVAGTEYMAGDGQRLPHYITNSGNVLYVRHPHAVTEGYTVTRGIDRERYQERAGLEGPFSTKSGKVVYYDKVEGKYYDPDTDMYIGHEDWIALNEGWKEKLAAAALAGTMALGAAGAQARVSPGDDPSINRLTGKPVATQVATGDQKPAVQAPKGYSKEYLQSVVDGKHPRPMISVEKAQELLKQMGESIDEEAPVMAKLAGGLGLGIVAAAGAPAIVGILGPLLGIPFAAYGAYSAAKLGMKGVEKLWDMAAEKLGGDDKVTQYTNAKLATLPPEQAKAAAAVVKQIGESRQGAVAEDATVGTIPANGTVGTSGGMSQRTQFAPTGKTTNAKFNKNGQIELDTEQEDDGSVNLDADAVKQLQQAGVQIKEEIDSPVASAVARRIMSQRLDLLQKYGPAKVTAAIDDVADFVGDVEEIGSSDVSGWVKQVEQSLAGMGESVNEGTDTLEGILSKFSTDYAKFKAGGDIDANQDFFDALYEYYFDEMPYGVKKARDGDPYEWITDRLDQESGVAPVAEAEEDLATPGDQAAADQNIIMQIRKASDYEKPTRIQLADGTESVIAPNIAKQLLAKFEKMKPESKALLQDTLNTEAGFKEITAYFGGGVREQAAARASKIMQAAVAEAGLGRYDRRDAYQRDYDSSVNMDRGTDHRGLNQELAHEDNDQYRVVIARGGKWEETKAQPRGPGMNAAMALINSLHAKFPSMHLGMKWPNGQVDNYGKKAQFKLQDMTEEFVDEASLAQMRDYFAGKMSLTDEPAKSKPGELARMRDHFSKEKPMARGGTAPNPITDKMPPDIVMILHAINKGTAITKAQFNRLHSYKMYGESVEDVAEGWQEDSQDLEDWTKEVSKKLYRAHENQRHALARQLSKVEQKHFGSELTNGPLTNIVFSTLQALSKGQMVHYDPQSVGQMPFGSMVGDDARIIAAAGVSSDELVGYRMLSDKGIVDNIKQFLQLRRVVGNKNWPAEYLEKFEGNPGALWLQFVKDLGWSKDDVREAVQAKTDDKLLAYYAQRKAEAEKKKKEQGVAEGDTPPLKKSTINKAHAIARAIEKDQ